MRLALILAIGLVTMALVSTAVAVPQGKSVEYEGGGAGKVIFDGKLHATAGKKCNDCHPKAFKMKKGSTQITMKGINEGQTCGVCHNGKDAFDAKTADNCKKCHLQ